MPHTSLLTHAPCFIHIILTRYCRQHSVVKITGQEMAQGCARGSWKGLASLSYSPSALSPFIRSTRPQKLSIPFLIWLITLTYF